MKRRCMTTQHGRAWRLGELGCWRQVNFTYRSAQLTPTCNACVLQGSEARRKAVTALGEALYAHMRACHVVPAACVAMAAVAGTSPEPPLPPGMLAGAALHPVALSGSRDPTGNPGQPGGARWQGLSDRSAAAGAPDPSPNPGDPDGSGVYPASAWRPLAEVREGAAWLQGELARRGALFNPVHADEAGGELDMGFFAELLPDSLETRDMRGQARAWRTRTAFT